MSFQRHYKLKAVSCLEVKKNKVTDKQTRTQYSTQRCESINDSIFRSPVANPAQTTAPASYSLALELSGIFTSHWLSSAR